MPSPSLIGCPRDKCKNGTIVNHVLIREMVDKIPLRYYDKPENKKIFDKIGGAVHCAMIVCGAYRAWLEQHYEIVTENDISEWILSNLPDGGNDPVHIAGFKAALEPYRVTRANGQELGWRDIFGIANAFGYPFLGLMHVSRFAYDPGRNAYLLLDGNNNYWKRQQVDEYVQPVLMDKMHGLYLDASTWLRLYASITSYVFDPALDPGLNYATEATQGVARITSLGNCIYNTYIAPNCRIGEYDPNCPEKYVVPFIEHCHNMFAGEGDADQFISWCAHIIQNPGEKVHWAPVMYSRDQGVGKDTLINFVQDIVGQNNCSTIKASQVRSDFNEFARSIIIRISELYDGNARLSRKSFQEEVKALISGDNTYTSVNQKYGAKLLCRNIAHVVITTNNPGELLVSKKDRRYDIFECRSKRQMGILNNDKNREYFDNLYSWYYHGGKEALYAFLLHWDLSKFDVALPRLTQSKKKLQISSVESYSWFSQVLDFVSERQPRLGRKAFRTDTIIAAARMLAETSETWAGPSEKLVGKYLTGAYRSFDYDHMRSEAKDGRWAISRRMTSIIKSLDYDDFDPREIALDFCTPEDLKNPISRSTQYETSELEPDPELLIGAQDQKQ